MARANRRDSNEPEIVRYFKSVGASVLTCDEVDLIVVFEGLNYLVEVKKHKTPGMHPDSYRLKPGPQADLHASWRGQICVVRDVEDCKRLLFPEDP